MADWRQIQARIRKARNASDPVTKLYELYQRTHDGMVAWEIALLGEKDGRSDEAVKWYKTAAEKFRRADWRKKAEEALTRLGAEAPPQQGPTEEGQPPVSFAHEVQDREDGRIPLALGEIPEEEKTQDSSEMDEEADEASGNLVPASSALAGTPGDPARKKRRRGRRGGRGRRRKGVAGAAPGLPAEAFAASSTPALAPVPPASPVHHPRPSSGSTSRSLRAREPERPRSEPVYAVPQLPSERAAHGRSDPALSSRMAHLESLLRRLMSSPLHRLGDAEEAPAGPGVFLLSDADQAGSYYVGVCQTLRVGISNLTRGGRSAKGSRGSRSFGDTDLKERLAEHLGINEAKVSQYMRDHCVVRWIQLDDEASHLAHFAIGLLRTPLNAE